MRMPTRLFFIILLLVIGLGAAGCSEAEVPLGPIGPSGPAGPQGPQGPPGSDATISFQYVGASRCAECHQDIYARYTLSGHANNLTKISSSEAPDFPFDSVTGGVSTPPEGYTWDQIAYVIGGFAWQAQFVDQNGYVITGEAQYNFPNSILRTAAGWVTGHTGEQVNFDCAQCHSTGYRLEGSQDNLDGVVGTWAFENVQCEACHGPGSMHARDPYGIGMTVDRSSQACASCHLRGDIATIEVQDGFVHQYETFSELHNSKHLAIGCAGCHDPHASTVYREQTTAVGSGVIQGCDTCHWEQAAYARVTRHRGITCLDCHMPQTGNSAASNPDVFTGDLGSHLFSINPNFDAPQFTEDGSASMPYLTLNYTCNHCHGVFATVKDPAQLQSAATGYHDRPTPTPEPTAVPTEEPTPEP